MIFPAYFCGHCNTRLSDHMARAEPGEPMGAILCPNCHSTVAVRSASVKGFIPLALFMACSFLGKAAIQPAGLFKWAWLFAEFTIMIMILYRFFGRKTLPVLRGGTSA